MPWLVTASRDFNTDQGSTRSRAQPSSSVLATIGTASSSDEGSLQLTTFFGVTAVAQRPIQGGASSCAAYDSAQLSALRASISPLLELSIDARRSHSSLDRDDNQIETFSNHAAHSRLASLTTVQKLQLVDANELFRLTREQFAQRHGIPVINFTGSFLK